MRLRGQGEHGEGTCSRHTAGRWGPARPPPCPGVLSAGRDTPHADPLTFSRVGASAVAVPSPGKVLLPLPGHLALPGARLTPPTCVPRGPLTGWGVGALAGNRPHRWGNERHEHVHGILGTGTDARRAGRKGHESQWAPQRPRPPAGSPWRSPVLTEGGRLGESALSPGGSERGRGTSDYKGRLSPGAGPRRAAPARGGSPGPAVDATRKAFL